MPLRVSLGLEDVRRCQAVAVCIHVPLVPRGLLADQGIAYCLGCGALSPCLAQQPSTRVK